MSEAASIIQDLLIAAGAALGCLLAGWVSVVAALFANDSRFRRFLRSGAAFYRSML